MNLLTINLLLFEIQTDSICIYIYTMTGRLKYHMCRQDCFGIIIFLNYLKSLKQPSEFYINISTIYYVQCVNLN